MNHLLLTCNKHTGCYYYYTVKVLRRQTLRHMKCGLILPIWLYHQTDNEILSSN